MPPKQQLTGVAAPGAARSEARASSPVVASRASDAAAGPDDEVPVAAARRGRPRRGAADCDAEDGSPADSGACASSRRRRGRLITDLRADSIENLRLEHRQLREAAKKAQKEMRNAKRRRVRILAKIRNLDVESVLSVLIDRGLPDPSAKTPAATEQPPPPPMQPTVQAPAPDVAKPPPAQLSKKNSLDDDSVAAAPADDEDVDLDDLMSDQPSDATGADNEPRGASAPALSDTVPAAS